MDTLPDELWQEIFARLAGFDQCFDLVRPNPPAFSDAIRAPFRIAATCTHWRALVLNSPELWAFVRARDDRPVDDVHLRTCIERSGQHPLDVWIHSDVTHWRHSSDDDDENDDDEDKDIDGKPQQPVMFFEWLDLLQRNAQRWRRVRIDFPRPTPIDKFAVFTKPMPLLEHLVLSTPSTGFNEYMVNTNYDSDLNPQHLYFHSCPNLRTLASHAAVMVPVATLSKLEYLNFSLRGLRDDLPLWAALAMMPALVELNIYFPYYGAGSYLEEAPPTPRQLPALRTLGILGYYRFQSRWDRWLTVPNLQTLVVSVEPCNLLRESFASFSSAVRHIVITTVENGNSGGYFSRSDAVALDELHHVETLELRDIPIDMVRGNPGDFFASLAGIVRYSGDPMPKWGSTLRKLILRDCEIEIDSCGSLASLVDLRTTAARDNADDSFEFQLINTRLIRQMHHEVPESLGPVMHLFEHAIIEVEPPVEDTKEEHQEDLEEPSDDDGHDNEADVPIVDEISQQPASDEADIFVTSGEAPEQSGEDRPDEQQHHS
ncbi:hypothetical protein BKA62DRAFT_696600 [Auriculariales sp. MPI-PUGE-AT-0066]|nr:hypothetical protein BKA62DRAFT_696600 [Auriculariales sp. MPI-PUGE-AT-0066]